MAVIPIDTIISDPNSRGGQPIIAGTNVRVSDVVASHIYRGLMPEELAVNFALNCGQVYAALAYYYMHKVEIDARMRAEADEAARLIDQLDAQRKLIRVE
jgi:uncharacterized protein (DUF433 family)